MAVRLPPVMESPLPSGSKSPMEKAQSAERASPPVSSVSPPSTLSVPCTESAAE